MLAHSLRQYRQEGCWPTARYMALRYLVSRPDQLRHTGVVAVTALLQTAREPWADIPPTAGLA
ncbi:hypothetical protein LRS06_22075 [Hymenobacter sp. J193]|uniref:hypothetical protein n=1 Tax=Hymenobacter sp. J193 TaxID=2898429 RepID=UPI00215101C1|nr:hypothetical protein [Hymenobacter sp. J193]MCR5890418.1 hypothetical protein [Hymenobacter sp. J193]